MLALLLVVNGALMIAMPLALVLALRRALGARWALALGGALAFVASQVVHIPLLAALTWGARQDGFPAPSGAWITITNAIVLGLAAALCEETARAILFLRFFPAERDVRDGLMAGAGHGGLESSILGGLALLTLLNMSVSRSLDAQQLQAVGVPADRAATALEQIAAYWATPWHEAILGAVERAIAIPLHLACSVLVALAVRDRRIALFAAAIAGHAITDGVAVIAAAALGHWATEGVLAAVTLPFASIAMLWAWRRRAPTAAPAPAA